MTDTRFALRTLIVTTAICLVLWLMLLDWPETAAQGTSSVYCVYGEGYYSRGAFLEMSGVTRICEVRTEDGEMLEWLDPDTVARRR